jgi:23S rRNA pseudouridine2604 synthase
MKAELSGIQVNKYISSSGYCSRREADKLIAQGRVVVNEDIALPSTRVQSTDKVFVDDELIRVKKNKSFTYIALYKPVGITTTTDLNDRTNVISFLRYPKRVFPIGRLDKDSEGLLLLTDNGDIVNQVLRAANHHEKEYIVSVNKQLQSDFAERMSKGVPILGTTTLPCKVQVMSSRKFKIILTQGLNRQIRRMCTYLGYEVTSLLRVRIMHIRLNDIKPGKWRLLNAAEIEKLESLG